MWWTVWSACQEPFGTDRHDLVGFRIAAVSASPTEAGDPVTPRAAVIVDGRPWASDPIELTWFWVDDPGDLAALDPLSAADAVGPEPELVVPDGPAILGIVARDGDRDARAVLEIAAPPTTFEGPTGITVSALPLQLRDLEGPELLLEARRALDPDPADAIPAGGFARITAEVEGDPLIRWMATAGTFFELDRHTADWAAGDLRLDGDALDEGRSALDDGWVTVLALALGKTGETGFFATDIPVGPAEPGLWTSGRFVPTEVDVAWQPGDAVRGTLVVDDTAPSGLRMVETEIEPAADVADWGTPALSCLVSRDGPFDPDWLLLQVCGREGLDGRRVVVVPEATR